MKAQAYGWQRGLAVIGMIGCLLATKATAASGSLVDDQAERDRKLQFFESRIRPVLIEHCHECHGDSEDDLQGGLRVDHRAGLLTGGDSGPALVPGKPEESLLLEAMRYEGLEMPPNGKLPAAVIADFEKWIADGAVDPRTRNDQPTERKTIDISAGREFWAFRPLQPASLEHPRSDSEPSRIDRFVLRGLDRAGLVPNPRASRESLIRRIHFDLTGLPPSPAEVHRFVNDDSSDAWARVVDRLLQSPEFGVHWGRHWLDVARYADSNGSDFNATFHNAWRYRDYVIDSFNQDKPFDEFVKEQLAGDLMPHQDLDDRRQKIIATGFLMLGTKMLSERDKSKMTLDVVDEQIHTVGQAFLGLTLGCARCHDHKFDPIPTRDYYALAGIFQSTRTLEGESQKYVSTWPRRELPADPEHVAAVRKFEARRQELQKQLAEAEKQQSQLVEQGRKLQQQHLGLLVDDADARKIGDWKPSTYSPQHVGVGYLHDDLSGKGEKQVEFSFSIETRGRYQVQISYNGGSGRATNVPVTIAHPRGEKQVLVDQSREPSIDRLFEPLGIFEFEKDGLAKVTISNAGTTGHVIVDAVRLIEVDSKDQPVQRITTALREQLENLKEREQQAAAKVQALKAELQQLVAQQPEPLPRSLAVDEAKEISDCRIRIRGEHDNPGENVPRGFLQVASAGETTVRNRDQSGRLELAEWIASPENPLTARVYANRIWYHLMGQGIVATVDNFGTLGSRPSHPELLDDLARQLIDSGWSTKTLIRQIVLSRTYQMSTHPQVTGQQIDPGNLLLWRANRKRLTAESIRDAMLAISGQLDRTPGESPVAGLGVLVTQNTADQKRFQRKESQRRSVYLPMIRAELPEFLTILDFADPDLVTGRRHVTNVPEQALLLLNSPFVMKQARIIADRLLSKTPTVRDFEKQVELAYPLVFARNATAEEVARAVAFLESVDQAADPGPALARFIHTLLASVEFRMLE